MLNIILMTIAIVPQFVYYFINVNDYISIVRLTPVVL